MHSSEGSAATMWTVTVFCWMTARSTLACSASAGTGSTATISKMQSFPQTGKCLPRSCSQAIKRDAKSASRSLCQRRKTSGTAQTVPPSKSVRKPPSASAGNGRHSLKRVSGCSPDELLICGNKQSARSDSAEI